MVIAILIMPLLLGMGIWLWLVTHMGSPRWIRTQRYAIHPPPAVTVLDGVVIPKRKAIEP